jgi:hypothetical protein
VNRAASERRRACFALPARIHAARLAHLATPRNGISVAPLGDECLVGTLVVLEPDTALVAAIGLGCGAEMFGSVLMRNLGFTHE